MTEEKLRQIAKSKYPYIKGFPQTMAHQEIFIEGAKWADKTMIEKACELLTRMIWEVTYHDLEDNSVEHYDKMEFIEDFKRAMEAEE